LPHNENGFLGFGGLPHNLFPFWAKTRRVFVWQTPNPKNPFSLCGKIRFRYVGALKFFISCHLGGGPQFDRKRREKSLSRFLRANRPDAMQICGENAKSCMATGGRCPDWCPSRGAAGGVRGENGPKRKNESALFEAAAAQRGRVRAAPPGRLRGRARAGCVRAQGARPNEDEGAEKK